MNQVDDDKDDQSRMPQMRCHVLIPCAGVGARAGTVQPKQYELLAGKMLVEHTLGAFAGVPRVASVNVVVSAGDDTLRRSSAGWRVIEKGGATRADSVFNGLTHLLDSGVVRASDWILVHDAARCLISPAQIDALIDACAGDNVGGLLALQMPDTLKQSVQGRVAATIPRGDKWLAQTPQMFRAGALHQALAVHAPRAFMGITDEASAMEFSGLRPLLVPGSAQNFKITYPEDFALAEAVLKQRQAAGTAK